MGFSNQTPVRTVQPSPERQKAIDEARDMVALYTKAEKAVLTGQSYSIGGQSLTRADLDKIRSGRKEWEVKLNAAVGVSPRVVSRIVVRDD